MRIVPGVLVHAHNPGSQRLEEREFKAILSYKHEGNVRENNVYKSWSENQVSYLEFLEPEIQSQEKRR